MKAPFTTATETARVFRCSDTQIRRILRKHGIRCRRPFRGQILLPRHRQNRLSWSRDSRNWTSEDWKHVLFSDECRFSLNSDDRRQKNCRKRGSRVTQCNIQEVDRWRSKSLMVWGGISSFGASRPILVTGNLTAARYVNDILQGEVLPMLRENHNLWAFQQDNAPAHKAAITTRFLNENNILTLPWPALSPDLNPIEHIWDFLKRKIRSEEPQNLRQLAQSIIRNWENLPQSLMDRVIQSMPRRIRMCIAARGGHTGY